MARKSKKMHIYFYYDNNNIIMNNNELINKTLNYIVNISKNIQNYLNDIRMIVEQAYLEGKIRINKEQIKQKFFDISAKELSHIDNITKKIMSILPDEKITFKGKFQKIIYKLAVIKEIFDNISQYLQNNISIEKAINVISSVSDKVKMNMEIKNSNFIDQRQIETIES